MYVLFYFHDEIQKNNEHIEGSHIIVIMLFVLLITNKRTTMNGYWHGDKLNTSKQQQQYFRKEKKT